MIIVFARAPVVGQAKTRLIPKVGEQRAARLCRELIGRALATALAADCGPVELHGTRRHSFFRNRGVPFREQRGRDLGERMHHAFSNAGGPAVLIGADCPALRPADLRCAVRWLRGGCEAVLAPAEDGGYALIALRRARADLFSDIAWGSERVYGETVKRLAGVRWRALRPVWDVDRPEDLERLRSLRLTLRSLRLTSGSRRGAPR